MRLEGRKAVLQNSLFNLCHFTQQARVAEEEQAAGPNL